MFDAMTLLRKDLAVLRAGFDWYNPLLNSYEFVNGDVSMLLGDSMQIVDYLRHGGNASTMNCPQCLITIPERLTWNTLLDTSMRRTTARTDTVVHAIEMFENATPNKKVLARRYLGIAASAGSSYLGPGFEPFLQAWRDPEHLFLYGLLKTLIHFLMNTLSNAKRLQLCTIVGSHGHPGLNRF
jgi:hypothetical protein